MKKLKEEIECPICFDTIPEGQLDITRCGHKYCKQSPWFCHIHSAKERQQVCLCEGKLLRFDDWRGAEGKVACLQNFGLYICPLPEIEPLADSFDPEPYSLVWLPYEAHIASCAVGSTSREPQPTSRTDCFATALLYEKTHANMGTTSREVCVLTTNKQCCGEQNITVFYSCMYSCTCQCAHGRRAARILRARPRAIDVDVTAAVDSAIMAALFKRLLLPALLQSTAPSASDPAGRNLVQNPDFVALDTKNGGQPAHWGNAGGAPGSPFSVTAGTAGGGPGGALLLFNGTDPKVYKLVVQAIPEVQPGIPYSMSVLIRTQNLSSSAGGGYASITGSWKYKPGAGKKTAGGTWPKGPGGTTPSGGFVNVSQDFTMPTDAVPGSFVLALYVRPKLQGGPTPTGLAWFGHVSLTAAPPPPPSCPPQPPAAGANLVYNPFFAIVTGQAVCGWGGIDGAVYSRSTTVFEPGSGATSLAFHGTDPKVYSSVAQHLPMLLPGVTYTMHASVKALNLTGSGGYASITGSWTNGKAESKPAGGTYPAGPSGTTEGWVTVGGAFTMPADAEPGSFVLHIYVRPFLSGDPTPTGRAWFTNVSVVHQPPIPMWSTLVSPVYRGQIFASDSGAPAVIVVVHFAFDAATTPPPLAVQLQLDSRPGVPAATYWRRERLVVANISAALGLNVTALMAEDGAPLLSPGDYSLSVSCVNISSKTGGAGGRGAVMATDKHNLTVLPTAATKPPRVSIDQQNRVVLDGKQFFFPMGWIGFCTTIANATQMALFQQSGFNAIMPYGECTSAQLDIAHRNKVKVAFSLKDIFVGKTLHYAGNKTLATGAEEEAYFKARVAAFKQHPAVLGEKTTLASYLSSIEPSVHFAFMYTRWHHDCAVSLHEFSNLWQMPDKLDNVMYCAGFPPTCTCSVVPER
eukprot:SAG22_NODE_600_length_8677_cov_18.222429_3_plen_915_part_00